jgi:hypothetical protein
MEGSLAWIEALNSIVEGTFRQMARPIWALVHICSCCPSAAFP